MSGNNGMRIVSPGVNLDEVQAQKQMAAVAAATGRAKNAFAFVVELLKYEFTAPNLPRMRELINLGFDAADYFQGCAQKPLQIE